MPQLRAHSPLQGEAQQAWALPYLDAQQFCKTKQPPPALQVRKSKRLHSSQRLLVDAWEEGQSRDHTANASICFGSQAASPTPFIKH